MIFVTGDTHSDFVRFNTNNFPEQKEMTKDDYVIICGDFGGLWFDKDNKGYKEQEYWLNWLNDKPFTTLFVDGNHENFDLLNSYEVSEWKGGRVHRIKDSIIHLMRGEMFIINDKKIFAFGGASSHDIQDGILEQDNWREEAKRLYLKNKTMFRVNHLSWWKEELPTNKELTHSTHVLEDYNYKCDFFISHCCSSSTQALLGYHNNDILTMYFEQIKSYIKFRKHFFGHYHDNRNLPDNEILLYEQIIQID